MNRYISADELLDRFCGTYECDECESYNDGKCTELVSFKKVRYIISKVPTADVVEVVRCKDCKHRDPEDHKCDCGMWHMPFATKDTDYCSYGEKKTK